MKRRRWLASLVVIAVVAFTMGRWVFPVSPEEEIGSNELDQRAGNAVPTSEVLRANDSTEKSGELTERERLLRRVELARARTAKMTVALDSGNELERMAAVVEMLQSMTPENWLDLRHAFFLQTVESGRMHNEEFILFMKQAGAVGGQEVMKQLWSERKVQDTRWALEGWAADDPDAAIAWMEGQASDQQVRMLWGSMIDGVAQSDPEKAFGMLESLPVSQREEFLGNAVEKAIQASGTDVVAEIFEESLLRIRESGEGQGDGYVAAFFKELNQHKLHQATVEKGEGMKNYGWGGGNKGDEYTEWLQKYDAENLLEPMDLFHAAKLHDSPENAMEWVLGFENTTQSEGMESMIKLGVGEWNRGDPEGLDAWLAANKDHQLHDAIMSGRDSARSSGVKKIIELLK